MIKRDTTTDNLYGANKPSQAGDIAFLNLFLWVFWVNVYRLFCNRKVMQNPVGAFFIFLPTPLLEVVGYGIRNASLNSPENNGLYMANMIIIGISPIYLTAVNFIVFGALIPFVGEAFSTWKSGALVCVATILLPQVTHLQTRGTAQAYDSSQSQAYRNVGSGLMLGGLFFQVILWIIYLIFFAKFQSRLHREGGLNLTEDKTARVRTTSLALYITILTFMIRTIYRIVEFSLLITPGEELNMLWLYLFDATPTLVGVLAFAYLCPYDLPFAGAFRWGMKKRCSNHDQEDDVASSSGPPSYDDLK
jgi:hypothetical protein